MANRVIYEWDVEELEEAETAENGYDPDILDHNHCDSYAYAAKLANRTLYGKPHRIVLVRDVVDRERGVLDRAWAYVKDGKLPETFEYAGEEDSGIRVPKRFHAEVAKVA